MHTLQALAQLCLRATACRYTNFRVLSELRADTQCVQVVCALRLYITLLHAKREAVRKAALKCFGLYSTRVWIGWRHLTKLSVKLRTALAARKVCPRPALSASWTKHQADAAVCREHSSRRVPVCTPIPAVLIPSVAAWPSRASSSCVHAG